MKSKKNSPHKKIDDLAPQGSLMVRSFTVENYLSFPEKTVLDFTVPKTQADYGWAIKRKGKDYLALMTGIFGANASGKTNILRGLAFVTWFMTFSFGGEKAKIPGIQGWANLKAPCRFKLESEDAIGTRFIYSLELTEDEVLKEELRALSLGEKGRGKQIFLCDENGVKASSLDFAKLLDGGVRSDASVISTLLDSFPQSPWGKLGWSNENFSVLGRTPIANMLAQANIFYVADKDLLQRAISYLRSFDLGLKNLEIKIENENDGKILTADTALTPFCAHQGPEGQEFFLDFENESAGTKNLYALLSFILPRFERGGLVLIDELEAELHPDIVDYILELFADEEINKAGAQLVFTSHLPDIMQATGKNLTWFAEKKNSQSTLTRLSEYRDVRMEENFSAKYRAGKWGGIPEIS